MERDLIVKTVDRVVLPFISEDSDKFASGCCGKLYVGEKECALCNTCKKVPENIKLSDPDARIKVIDFLVGKL